MANKKWDNATKLICGALSFLGILVGTFGTIIYKEYLEKPKPVTIDHSIVQQFQGIYLYIRSRPERDYSSLGTVKTNTLTRAIENASGKKGFGKILESIGNTIVNDLEFENRLKEIVEGAKQYNEEVQGVIFLDNLTQCELIKFKKQ